MLLYCLYGIKSEEELHIYKLKLNFIYKNQYNRPMRDQSLTPERALYMQEQQEKHLPFIWKNLEPNQLSS